VAFGKSYRDPIVLSIPAQFAVPSAGANFDPPFSVHMGVRGCTVNTCTGTDRTGSLRSEQFGAAFESMEGAALAQVGADFGIPVCEVRAISNFAAHRDMRPENIRCAIANLARYLRACVQDGPIDSFTL
jgi:nucleoside phosphorylase